MAVSWGGWVTQNGLSSFRLGIDLSGKTLIVYGQAQIAHSWNATLARSGPWSGSSSVSFSSSNGTTTTKELYRQTVSANGTYGVSLTVPWGTNPTASVSRAVSFTAPPTGAPGKPSFVRKSGTALVLSWGAVAGATSYDIDYQYKWSPGGGSARLDTVSGLSRVTSGYPVNSDVVFWVRARNAGGAGPWSPVSDRFYTPPGTPSTPVLSVAGGLVTGTVSGSSYYKSGLEVERSTGDTFLVGSGTSGLVESFTDSTAGVGIKYRCRRFVGADDPNLRAYSAWSGWSVAVTSIAPPLAPTVLAPLGSVTNAEPVVFRFVHQPVDGTALSAVQIQYRTAGGSDAWVLLSATAADLTSGSNGAWSWTLSEAQMDALVAMGPQVEYQVHTRGQHPDYGPWSPTQIVRLVSPPACGITSPEPGAYAKGTLTVAWGFGQAEGLPQSAWRAVLYVDGVAVETKQASNSTKNTTFGMRLENGSNLRVEVAVAASGVWSEPTALDLEVAFIPPAPATIDAAWDEETGVAQIDVTPGPGVAPSEPTVRLDVLRSVDDGQSWEPLAEGLPAEAGGVSLTDPECLSHGTTLYQVIAYTALDAETTATEELVADSPAIWLSSIEDGYMEAVRLLLDPKHTVTAARDREVKRYSGRDRGVVMNGRQRRRNVQGRAYLHESMLTPTLEKLEALAWAQSPHLYRDGFGRRIYGAFGELPAAWEQTWRNGNGTITSRWQVTFSLEETDQ